MSTFELYVLLQLPLIREVAIGGFVVSIIVAVFGVVGMASSLDEDKDIYNMAKRIAKYSVPLVFFFGMFMAILPDKGTMLALVAYELGGNIEGLSELPADLVGYLRTLLDQAAE